MCEELPDDSTVVRYVRPSQTRDDGTIDGAAFQLRPDEDYLSVQWLEQFDHIPQDKRLEQAARLIRLRLSKTGRFAKFNVGAIARAVQKAGFDIRFLHYPLEASNDHEADPSHSGVSGLPSEEDAQSELVGDLIARCIKCLCPIPEKAGTSERNPA